MSDTTLYTGDIFYLQCMYIILLVRFFGKTYAMLDLLS